MFCRTRKLGRVALLSLLVADTASASDVRWAQAAVADLRSIHDLIEDNHPGPVDPANPGFGIWLDHGEVSLQAQAHEAATESDYRTVLRDYVNGFADGHLGVSFPDPERSVWPGFLTRTDRPDRATHVVLVDGATRVAFGDILLSCDGTPTQRLLEERVLRPLTNPAVPQRLILTSPHLMVLGADDVAARAKRCKFLNRTGIVREIAIDWRPIDDAALKTKLQLASGIEVPALGLRRLGDVWLVSIPSFDWTGANATRMQQLIASIHEKAAELHDARHLVIDLRGNGGGDSQWGEDVATALWDKKTVDAIEGNENATVDWRVSARNLQTIRADIENMRRSGHDSGASSWESLAARMQQALAAKQTLLRVTDPSRQKLLPRSPPPFLHPVLIVTEPHCASACLDFLDLLAQIRGTERIGLQSSADTDYLDLASAPLASGHAVLDYAMKVYRDRARGSNVAYEPNVDWPGGRIADAEIARWADSFTP